MVLTGAGDAFVAGTDISGFLKLASGADGVVYEAGISRVLDRLEQTRVPTVTAVDGHCLGGGLVIATVCDFRIATPRSTFGYPMARTLGNCLSVATLASLADLVGPALTHELVCRAPLTQWATQETLRRLRSAGCRVAMTSCAPRAHLVRTVYGSSDFHHGVRNFLAKMPQESTGR